MTFLETDCVAANRLGDSARTANPKATKKRILFVGHSGLQGGGELCLETLVTHLDRTRYEPLLVLGSGGSVAERCAQFAASLQIRPLCWWMCFEVRPWYVRNLLSRCLANIKFIADVIRRETIDLVYTNSAVIFEAAIAARRCGVPHIWHIHEVLTPAHMRPRLLPLVWIARQIDRLSDRVIFESQSARRIAQFAIPAEKSIAIYNSVRFCPTTQDQASARQKLGMDEAATLVCFVGRFSDRKNPLMLLRAAAELKQLPNLQFLFVGEGPLAPALNSAIATEGLSRQARLLPFQPDIEPILAALDVLVLTSTEESFGLVLAEAAAFSKPVIATRAEGPGEIVVHDQTGILVEVDNHHQLAQAIVRLHTNPSLRRELGAAARSRAQQLFSAETNARAVEQVIDQVLEARQKPVQ